MHRARSGCAKTLGRARVTERALASKGGARAGSIKYKTCTAPEQLFERRPSAARATFYGVNKLFGFDEILQCDSGIVFEGE